MFSKGYGNFKCVNCKWFSTARRWNKNDEATQTCAEKHGVRENTMPCVASKKSLFTPIECGGRIESIKRVLNSLDKDDVPIIRYLIDQREEMILREGITNFRIGLRVVFDQAGRGEISGEIVNISRTHVTVLTEEGWEAKLLPGSVRFALKDG